jgi:hypothetical protein
MSLIEYRVMRNVAATNDKGQDCRVAIALVMHENGVCQRVAIDEELIKFAGEGIIEDEVKIAAAVPADASIVKNLNHYDQRR